jgi:hypothetical protein
MTYRSPPSFGSAFFVYIYIYTSIHTYIHTYICMYMYTTPIGHPPPPDPPSSSFESAFYRTPIGNGSQRQTTIICHPLLRIEGVRQASYRTSFPTGADGRHLPMRAIPDRRPIGMADRRPLGLVCRQRCARGSKWARCADATSGAARAGHTKNIHDIMGELKGAQPQRSHPPCPIPKIYAPCFRTAGKKGRVKWQGVKLKTTLSRDSPAFQIGVPW